MYLPQIVKTNNGARIGGDICFVALRNYRDLFPVSTGGFMPWMTKPFMPIFS
jgi:hypothetical protein